MKILFLAALVGTATCGWWSTTEDENTGTTFNDMKFAAGSEYVYKYESQVLSGLPMFSKQYGGIKVVAKAKLAFTSATQCVMQLEEVSVLSMNHEIHDAELLPPTKQIAYDMFSPLPTEQARLVIEKLQKPLKFSYVSGKVTSLEVSDEEANWSIDLKRSIIGMLQVRLQATDFTETLELKYNQLEKENYTTFDWLEPALDGVCYSSVHVSQALTDTTHFKVIKSRDENRCTSLNSVRKDVMSQEQRNCECKPNMDGKMCVCKPEEMERKNEEVTVIKTIYDLVSTDRTEFLIHKAVQTVQYRHEVPHAPNQYVMTASNQTLTLVEEKQQHSVSVSGSTFISISEPWRLQVLSEQQEKLMMSEQELMQTVRTVLSELTTISSDPQRYEDHATVFSQLMYTLRLCKADQLQTLYTEARASDNTSQNKKWKLLLDGLTYANTTVCDKFLLDQIKSGDIKELEASSIFAIWAADKVPTPTVLDYLKDTILPSLEGSATTTQKLTWKHAMLSFGSMVRRFIVQEHRHSYEALTVQQKALHTKRIEDCRKYEKFVEIRLSAATTEEQKILYLKTMANLGNIKALSMVHKLLENTEPKAVRIQAIWAFYHFGQQNQLQTLQSLLPLMLHHREDSELRIAAFVMVMRCDPSSSLLEVQKHLNSETDREYKTFVVKYLKNYLLQVKRDAPGVEQRHSMIRMILNNIRAFHLSEDTVDMEIPFGLFEDQKTGDIIRISFLGNETSRFARAASFQQLAMTNGVRRHIAEVGYRSEGLEQIISKLMEKTSAVSSAHSDLSVLNSLNIQKSKQPTKPSITFYAKVMGQHITFAHFDETAINTMILEGLKKTTDEGEIELPIRFFQTIYMKPYQLRKMQPNGMFQTEETLYSGVVDVDGKLVIKMVTGEMPFIKFETTKPLRKEFKTIHSHYVDAGFTLTGIISAMTVRRTINSANLTIAYLPVENKFVMNHTKPLQDNDLASMELRAYTSTFVLPMRLPQIVKTKDTCFKNLKTDDSDRKTFTHEFEAMKSVELNAKMEVDVNMPKVYSFVRERLHLLPTDQSIHNQFVKISVKPATSASRDFSLVWGGRYFKPSEIQLMEGQISETEQRMASTQQQTKDSFFKSLFWDSTESKGAISQEEVKAEEFLKSDSLGSLFYMSHFSLASISTSRTLNMSGNLTKYYEHDFPTTHALFRFERPAIPSSSERETVLFTNRMISTVNPGNNEFLWAHNMTWGERSVSLKPRLTWTIKSTPHYKDSVCISETVNGCKDQFGVVYPTWFNLTHHFGSMNLKRDDLIIERFMNWTKPFLMNIAESVYTLPMLKAEDEGKFMMEEIIKPESNKMDLAFNSSWNSMPVRINATNMWAPMEVQFWQYVSKNQYPVSQIRPVYNLLPVHHRINPFESRRDVCVIQTPKSITFDRKELLLAKTDCEVILVGDCRATNKQLLVTVKPASSQDKSLKKELKVVLGSNKVQIELAPRTIYSAQQLKVKVNDAERTLNKDNQVIIEESNMPVAVVQCDAVRCEILSEKFGIYVSIDSEKVKVEVNKDKSQEMCGLCAFTPERSVDELTMTDSLNLIKENQVANQQCTVVEPTAQELQSAETCKQEYKHKIKYAVDDIGRILTCVSVNRLPVCSSRCHFKSVRTNTEQFRCVSHSQALELDIVPLIQGEEMILEDERVLLKMKSSQQMLSNINIALTCNK